MLKAALLPLVSAVFLMLQGTIASACSPNTGRGYDKRIRVEKDCSFLNAGVEPMGYGTAKAVIDVGNQRVAQKLMYSEHSCYTTEMLFFNDCSTGEAILIYGLRTAGSGGGMPLTESIALLQRPHGPVAIRPSSTVDALRRVADKIDANNTTDIASFILEQKPKNRFDPACGCKLFYPDSVGASQ